MRIGILGEPLEPEVKLLSQRLVELGVEAVIVNFAGFPRHTKSEFRVEKDGLRLIYDGKDVSDVAAWYVRRFGFTDPLIKEELTKEGWNDIYNQFREWIAVENEKAIHIGSIVMFLSEMAPMINPPPSFIGHLRKAHQVYLIRKAGLPVPDFMISNDADAIRAFMTRHGDNVVYKPLAGPRHVRILTRQMLDERAHALQTEPILVQALAEGRHVRAYVAGDRVVGAAEVLFDREKSIDYRETQRGVEVLDLPDALKAHCVRAARACSMDFTGLDVIIDEARGTWKFLECNPSPMFANFERMTNVPVSTALAQLLVERAKARGAR
jgi:glutathione synthase/RimK-type ligase-like ATP-grasp enzyme